jgi:hypothetical protein
MESIDLQSMSLDELWALDETICAVLARKLEAEKRSLERRLNELSRVEGRQRDPCAPNLLESEKMSSSGPSKGLKAAGRDQGLGTLAAARRVAIFVGESGTVQTER